MSATRITVHDWLQSFQMGETRRIPSNMDNPKEEAYYAFKRFGYSLKIDKEAGTITRYCPCCKR